MFTNISSHGGNFKDVLNKEFSESINVSIASGYASLDVMKDFEGDFIKIAKK